MDRRTARDGEQPIDELHRLRQENAALRRQNHELEEFAAMAAHEVLKPLVLSEARASTVLERSARRLDIVSQQDLESLIRASSRARLEIESLLADLQSSGGLLRRQYVDMAEVVRSCLDLLGPEIASRHARITVEPMPVVAGDAALLGGVVGNLLMNALKHGGTSKPIRVACQRSSSGWRFEIDSPGRPIPERDRDAIFEPWQRGRGERRARGAGLGLTIVRRIVERHGGEVGVQPLGTAGNRFFFTLPAT